MAQWSLRFVVPLVLLLELSALAGAVTVFTGETKVGILHSLTGTMAISEQTVVNAEQMAIDEINEAGGLLGQKIVPVIEDGESDWDVFAEKAELFTNPTSSSYVKVVFGCWTSASRKSVLPVFERNNHMLFYPVQYEGQECSNNIFYTGAAPNQQIEPAVDWLLRYKGKQFFLVGSDYVFPRTANEIIRGQLAALGGTVVGEMYLALGESSNSSVGAIVDEIQRTLPNGGVIFNTLNGDSNVKFFHMFYDAGLRADTHPTMSVSITETEISVIGVQYLVDHYASWNYFMSTAYLPDCEGGFDPTASKNFVEKYRSLYGANELVNDPMESAYIAVHLWAQAVSLAGTFDLEPVRRAVIGQAFPAPEGEVVMKENHHISKFVRIGQVQANGDFSIIYTGTRAVSPEPWNQFVDSTRGYACDWSDPANKGGFYPLQTMEVALVHALSGPAETAERQFLEAELVAIKDINKDGGVLGNTLLPVVIDTGSDDSAALAALQQIAQDPDGPVVIFGNVASDSAYEAAVAGTRIPGAGPPLLLSPAPTVGGQSGEHVLHFGGVPNQQVLPAVQYFSKRARDSGASAQTFYIVGPLSWKTSGALDSLTAHVAALGDTVAGVMAYKSSSSGRRLQVAGETSSFSDIVSGINSSMPSGGVVINVLDQVADTLALLREMDDEGMPAGAFPVLSPGLSETDIGLFQTSSGGSLLMNQYVSLAYLSAVETSANVAFVKSMAEWYGTSYKVVSLMEAAYVAVRYWASAAQAAGSVKTQEVQRAMWGKSYNAPSGLVQLNESNYLSKPSRLGTLDAQGKGFRAVAGDGMAISPEPWWLFPSLEATAETDFSGWLKLICEAGQGLISQAGAFQAGISGSTGCDWCSPGRRSVVYETPELLPTRVCEECPEGESQANPGQGACEPCAAGTFANIVGRQACAACPLGKFAQQTGSSTCTACPPPMVTIRTGSTTEGACICPAGMYKVTGQMSCMACPAGINCPIGTDQSSVDGLESWTFTGEVKVGILHSLTGTMAISEQTVVNAELMAIGEINEAGGLLGMQIVPVIEDGESDWDVFAEKAELFTDPSSSSYVKVVFGCWTSASRKSVLPVFERNNHMLFYPVQYEGQECSNNIFYTGAAPNQQIEPAVDWLLRYKGKQFFLVGSDYVFPRTANEIIRGQLAALGGTVVGEMYLPLGESSNSSVGAIVDEIQRTLPSSGVIFNTLNGDSNVKFFHMLFDAGLRADTHPVMSVSITETEISVIGVEYLVGHFAAWNYFMSTKDLPKCEGGFDPTESKKFVEKYQLLYGEDSLVNDPMEAAYIAVKLWAQAVSLSGTFDLEPVRKAVIGQAFAAPEGEVVMQSNHHISKFVRIGEVAENGDFQMVYQTTRSVYPEPWNSWVQSTNGYACDWTDPVNLGGFYKQSTVEVALVHSLTGPRASSEKAYLEAEMAAIKAVNRNGGVLGKVIIPRVFDGQSNDSATLDALRQIVQDDTSSIAAIFGSAPSDAEYQALLSGPALTGDPPLLLDPRRSFGGECGEYVVHTGGLVNQQLLPALRYFSQRARAGGRQSMTFYAVGPAELESGGAFDVLRQHIEALSDTLAGVAAPTSAAEAKTAAAAMQAAMPDGGTVINLLTDKAVSLALVQEMQELKMPTGAFPVVFTGLAETDIPAFGDLLANRYISLAYFSSLELPQSTIFLDIMQEFYGSAYQVTDRMESAYVAMLLWTEAVRAAGTFTSTPVLHKMWTTTLQAPTGPVQLTGSNYLSKQSRLGTLNAQGTGFRVTNGNSTAILPEPFWLYPGLGSVEEMCDFMKSLRTICPSGKGLVNDNGTFLQSWAGAVDCGWCKQGSHSVAFESQGQPATRICAPCDRGTKQSMPGQDDCMECELGTFAELAGQTGCLRCPFGTFANNTGESICKGCGGVLTTPFPGASLPEHCICPEEYFMQGGTCELCPSGMTCETGSDTKYFPAAAPVECLDGLPCNYPGVIEGHMTLEEEPLSVWRCAHKERCPGGAPGTCAAELHGRACQTSTLGWIWDGEETTQCASIETGGFLFPAVPLLMGPVIVVVLYKFFGDTYERWGSWRNGIASVAFIILNHYQVINIIRNANIAFPVNVAATFETFSFTSDVSTIFKPGCSGYADFGTSVTIKSLAPLIVLAVYIATWALSQLVGRWSKVEWLAMEKNRTANGFFSLMFTFFAGITEVALLIFKCGENPNGMNTLLADRSIICGESEWQGLVGIGVLAILFWVIGLGALFVRTVVLAPKWFYDPDVQMRWKFLFIKFRPDVHYWALVLMVKGVALNIGFTFLKTGVSQIYWMIITLTVYTGGVVLFRPWRHMAVNGVDIVAQICLVLVCSVLSWFGHYALQDPHVMDQDMSEMAIAFALFCLPGCVPTTLYMIWQQTSSTGRTQKATEARKWNEAVGLLSAASKQDFDRFMSHLTEFDFWFCTQAAHIILTEFKGEKSRTGLSTGSSTSTTSGSGSKDLVHSGSGGSTASAASAAGVGAMVTPPPTESVFV